MKTSKLILATALSVCVFAASAYTSACNQDQSVNNSENFVDEDLSGMFFSTDNVVKEYEYDDAYCIVYDDADANLFNVEIYVDLETWQMITSANKENKTIVGTLMLNEDYSSDEYKVYTYMEDPEFEMAESSAKRERTIKIECLTITNK